MADEKSGLFTKKAQSKLRSPDDLDEYVRVTNPSVWVVLAACVLLMVGLFAWGLFGTAHTSVGAVATCVDGEVVAFLPADAASKVSAGNPANVEGKLMEVASVETVPLSRLEAREIVGSDFLASTLVQDDWTYLVTFKSDGDPGFAEGVPFSVNVTTENVAPIDVILGSVA